MTERDKLIKKSAIVFLRAFGIGEDENTFNAYNMQHAVFLYATYLRGYPTFTKYKNGDFVCVGDIVCYDERGVSTKFEVVFEDNAFRKKYEDWPENQRTLLETHSNRIELYVFKRWDD